MCDFIINIGMDRNPKEILDLLKSRYSFPVVKGQAFLMSWGSINVLQNQFFGYGPIMEDDGTIFVVVGRPLILNKKVENEPLVGKYEIKEEPQTRYSRRLYQLFERLPLIEWVTMLSGEFAIIIVNTMVPKMMVITDPMNTISIYQGRNRSGELKAVGTHPDIVALVSGCEESLDLASITDFLIQGKVTFPYTYYKSMEVLPPGSCCKYNIDRNGKDTTEILQYWKPVSYEGYPKKMNEWAEELEVALRETMRDWVGDHKRVGVLLSGGMDSRVVLAGIPRDRERVAFTALDKPNRQTEIVRKVVAQTEIKWVKLFRHKEYYGNQAEDAIKLCGGDPTFLDAHFMGFRERILNEGIDLILGGYCADTLLKGYFCSEPLELLGRKLPIKRKRRYKGPEESENYGVMSTGMNDGLSKLIKKEIIEEVVHRHKIRYEYMKKMRKDGSQSEWCEIWPTTVDDSLQNISVHRRILPKSEVFYDKRILEIAAQIPQCFKINSKVYRLAILPILGELSKIRIFESGVPLRIPLPFHYSFLLMKQTKEKLRKVLQGSIRKAESRETNGSWPNRVWYWENSRVLESLRIQAIKEPPFFLNELINFRLEELFEYPISIFAKYRLLQLCIWDKVRKIIED